MSNHNSSDSQHRHELQTLAQQILAALGRRLSPIISGAVLRSACRRCNIDPASLTVTHIPPLIRTLERSLGAYMKDAEVQGVLEELHAMAPLTTRLTTGSLPAPPGEVRIRSDQDVHSARATTLRLVKECGLGTFDAVRIATVASELARNALLHGGGGVFSFEILRGHRKAVRLTVRDSGPGIPHVDRLLAKGGGAAGTGIRAAQRIMDTLHMESSPGRGTTVIAERFF